MIIANQVPTLPQVDFSPLIMAPIIGVLIGGALLLIRASVRAGGGKFLQKRVILKEPRFVQKWKIKAINACLHESKKNPKSKRL